MTMSQQDKTNYKRRYNEANYSRIGLYLPPEEKDRWQNEAKKQGLSLSEFIKSCVNRCLGEWERSG